VSAASGDATGFSDAHVSFRYAPAPAVSGRFAGRATTEELAVGNTPALEDLSVGDQAPPLVVEKLTRTNFVRYAGASGDFNPMHHDDTIATQVGNPSVFGHGMLTAGLMARVVKDWFGPEALRRFQVRFSKQVWPEETLTCTATVTAVHQADGLVDLECEVTNADGEVKLTGTATAAVAPKAA
jgi:peroxisomal enoyl-CoA hydratase 2